MMQPKLTREQAELIGLRRQRLARRVERMVAFQPPIDADESLMMYTTKEKDPYYRTMAGQAIGRPLAKGEEVHVITHAPGIEDAEVCIAMADSLSHKRLEFFMDQGWYLNQLPNGSFEVANRPLKCIVDVV